MWVEAWCLSSVDSGHTGQASYGALPHCDNELASHLQAGPAGSALRVAHTETAGAGPGDGFREAEAKGSLTYCWVSANGEQAVSPAQAVGGLG